MKHIKNFSLNNPDWKKSIPVPVFDEEPDYIHFYNRAWELAKDHVRDIPGLPQTPYMDEAFWNVDIWIWDTCFMLHFCKYAPDVFPGIETLNNFYEPLHGGHPLPKVYPDEKASRDYPPDQPVQLCIHIPDNPPLFAWIEYSYALMTGDKEHLRKLLLEKQYLQKHFAYLESLTKLDWIRDFTRAPTCWVTRENGYHWEGGRSGMDNTPRGRMGEKAEAARPHNPGLLWIDAISQQALSCLFISRIAALLEEKDIENEWKTKYETFKEKINRLYWDETDGFYYDIQEETLAKNKCLTPASFWTVLAEIPDAAQVERMCRFLTDPGKLGGFVPWVTLARDDADFVQEGGYWRGSLWLPTAYMGIKSLEKYGKFELAHDTAKQILYHMYRTWKDFEPHSIWECYSPAGYRPSSGRKDFCGWSALGPIALFIENVIGITGADTFRNRVTWHLPREIKGRLGIQNYTFGDTTASFIFENGTVAAESDAPFTLCIDGKDYAVPSGKSSFCVSR